MQLWVVKRSFRSNLGWHPVGSIITDPTGIRLFKLKVSDGKVVEITDNNLENLTDFFKVRIGIDLPAVIEDTLANLPEVTTEQPESTELTKGDSTDGNEQTDGASNDGEDPVGDEQTAGDDNAQNTGDDVQSAGDEQNADDKQEPHVYSEAELKVLKMAEKLGIDTTNKPFAEIVEEIKSLHKEGK